MSNTVPTQTTPEFIRSLLEIVNKVKETLEAADKLFRIDEDLMADGGDPFFGEPDDVVEGKWNPPCSPDLVDLPEPAALAAQVSRDGNASGNEEIDTSDLAPTSVEEWPREVTPGLAEQIVRQRRQEEERLRQDPGDGRHAQSEGDSGDGRHAQSEGDSGDGRHALQPQEVDTSQVVRKRRAPVLHRAKITDTIEEEIIDALVHRNPKPRMQDLATEYGCSQATISRIWKRFLDAQENTSEGTDDEPGGPVRDPEKAVM